MIFNKGDVVLDPNGNVGFVAGEDVRTKEIIVSLRDYYNTLTTTGLFYYDPGELRRGPYQTFVTNTPTIIKKVIFNDPATIVFWTDGSKTVVKCGEYDIFDPEKGLAMAISKKALGNQGNYYETFKKYLPEEEADDEAVSQFWAQLYNMFLGE